MPDTGEDVVADEVSGTDADESEFRAVVIDKNLIMEAGDEEESQEDDNGGS